MSYIGNTATTQAFTPAVDYFSGNGSTTAFTLSRPVASVAQVEAVIDNVVQNPSSAYTVSNNTITFTSAPLSGTNNIYVRYTSPITQVIAPSAGSVGSSQLASLSTIPTTGGNITVPAVTGTMMVSGNQQGFSAYLSANQSISANTFTKAQFNTTEFNLGSAYDATTNYRFTPTVAGYYQVNLAIYTAGAGSSQGNGAIYKNGSMLRASQQVLANSQIVDIPAIIYLNGSTDYLEAYGYIGTVGGVIAGGSGNAPYCYFQAMLIRNA